MAFDGSYDFRVRPYDGDLRRYGFGPAYQWFDFYSGENGPSEPTVPGPEDDDTGDGQGQQQSGGPDSGQTEAQQRDGLHGTAYQDMTPAQFNQAAQDRANRNFVERNIGPFAAALGFPGILGFAVGRGLNALDQSLFEGTQAIHAANFAGKGQPMPDEFMSLAYGGGGSAPGGQTQGGTSGTGVEGQAGFLRNGGRVKKSGLPPPRFVKGNGDGRSDSVPGSRYRLSAGEVVIPADAVSAAGRGSSEAGARKLGDMTMALRKQHMNRMAALPPPRS